MSADVATEPCFNCSRNWHHQCEQKDCRKCHGSDRIDAGKTEPPAAPEVPKEPPQGDPALAKFAQQLLISFKVNAFLSGENAPLAIPVNCPEHGWVTTPLITCNRCLRIYPVLAFALPEQKASSPDAERTNEAVIFCDCGLRYYHARCPLCEGQVDHIVNSADEVHEASQ